MHACMQMHASPPAKPGRHAAALQECVPPEQAEHMRAWLRRVRPRRARPYLIFNLYSREAAQGSLAWWRRITTDALSSSCAAHAAGAAAAAAISPAQSCCGHSGAPPPGTSRRRSAGSGGAWERPLHRPCKQPPALHPLQRARVHVQPPRRSCLRQLHRCQERAEVWPDEAVRHQFQQFVCVQSGQRAKRAVHTAGQASALPNQRLHNQGLANAHAA